MSEGVYHDPESSVNIVAYAGPARPDGGPRKRYQLSSYGGPDGFEYVTLSTEEWDRLREWVRGHD